jgi:hypothetical protein
MNDEANPSPSLAPARAVRMSQTSRRLSLADDCPSEAAKRKKEPLAENSDLAASIEVAAQCSQAATMYKAVGISGCEPPQPQQFGRKTIITRQLNAAPASQLRTPATNFADRNDVGWRQWAGSGYCRWPAHAGTRATRPANLSSEKIN